MVLLLAIGDMCVPYGAVDIHPKLKVLLQPGKIEHILCTGNLSDKGTLDFLRSVSSNLTMVQGDLDDVRGSGMLECIQVEGFRIGVCRGTSRIECTSTWVDVLVKGHSHASKLGHAPCTTNDMGQSIIHPGSASGFESDICSFVLMDIKGDHMVCYWYSIPVHKNCRVADDDTVRVETFEFSTTTTHVT